MSARETNPKTLIGIKKVSLSKVPSSALAHCAMAMMDGAKKYKKYNWRETQVEAEIYVDAALRHIMSWYDGEDTAQDSGVHHLGHAMACMAIVLDAMETGNLIDDRPAKGAMSDVLERMKGSYDNERQVEPDEVGDSSGQHKPERSTVDDNGVNRTIVHAHEGIAAPGHEPLGGRWGKTG